IRGIAQTKAAFAKARAEMEAAAPAASKAAGEVLARTMISRAPRATGATASSIRVDTDGETAHVGPTMAYARFPEFGTVFISGQHYMTQAADDSQGAIVASIAAILKAALR
ncbi:MAG: HK97-gp10 family putative phage morphogenesis protein, partial [Nitrospiraceae bacterium]